ncbi:MAG: RDD family protein [Clostridiales bacterium]|jgi:uncharacterized RDD family membrane protein YckC|nr:RDD family protein [Clostridiales bacterium]
MNYTTIITPDNIEIEYRLAGAGSRLAAAFVDMLLQFAAIAVFFAVTLFAFYGPHGFAYLAILSYGGADSFSMAPNFWAVVVLGAFAIYYLYFVAAETAFGGRTLGKKLLGLRVIRDNGMPITLRQSLIRNIIRFIVDFFGVGAVMILFNKKCKRLGDIAAGTIVIGENKYAGIKAPELFPEISAGPEPRFPLSEEEYLLLREFFDRKDEFKDEGLFVKSRFRVYFSQKFKDFGEYYFTEDVLREIMTENQGKY